MVQNIANLIFDTSERKGKAEFTSQLKLPGETFKFF